MNVEIAAAVADRESALLDRIAEPAQGAVRSALGGNRRFLANILDGVWLSVPLHPVVTDVPIGASTTAVLLDGWATVTGDDRSDGHADAALTVAVGGAIAAVATGLAEWRFMQGGNRRAATLHGLINLAGLSFNVGSLWARRAGQRRSGRALGLAGLMVTGIAAHLGGELSYGLGVRVNPNPATAEDAGDGVASVAAADLTEGALIAVEVDGEPVVVARSSAGGVCAIAAKCSHVGGPLNEGERQGDTVICPWHQSRFDLCTGAVIDGPAVFPQPRYVAVEHGERIEISRDKSPTPLHTPAHRDAARQR